MSDDVQVKPLLTLDTPKYDESGVDSSEGVIDLGLVTIWSRPTLADLADAGAAEIGSSNTRAAFRSDWLTWAAFCEMTHRAGVEDAPVPRTVDSRALFVFATWLAAGPLMPDGTRRCPAAPESIRRRLTGVLAGWKTLGVDYPRDVSGPARKWVNWHEAKLIEKGESTGRGKAAPLTITDLNQISATTPPTLAGARDLALVLLDFSVAGRRSEVAFLDVADVFDAVRGLDIHIRRSKSGHRKVVVPPGENPATCPVRAWRRWRDRAGLADGPAFRQVNRHDNLGGRLSGAAVGEIVTRAAKRAGIGHRTGHSARRGFATEARTAGRTVEQIADRGGWKRNSPVLHGYIDSVDRWTDNVMIGLGL